MKDAVTAVLYVLLYAAAVRGGLGVIAPGGRGDGRRPPVATLVALVLVGVPSLVQLTAVPALLGDLDRDRTAIAHGQLWRLVTALVVQDGGAAGAVFNLATLLVVGAVAESVLGRARWAGVALLSGVAGQLWGLVVQPVGAGNSVAVFGLAAAVAVAALRVTDTATRVAGAACLVIGAVLLVIGDIHGGAVVAGAIAGRLVRRPAADASAYGSNL